MKTLTINSKFYLFIFLIITGCHPLNKNAFINVEKINLKNHTEIKRLKKSVEIVDKVKIRSIANELKQLKLYEKEVNTKANFGLIELSIFNNGEESTFDLIYTEYDGVVIYKEETPFFYKSDNLQTLAEGLLK